MGKVHARVLRGSGGLAVQLSRCGVSPSHVPLGRLAADSRAPCSFLTVTGYQPIFAFRICRCRSGSARCQAPVDNRMVSSVFGVSDLPVQDMKKHRCKSGASVMFLVVNRIYLMNNGSSSAIGHGDSWISLLISTAALSLSSFSPASL